MVDRSHVPRHGFRAHPRGARHRSRRVRRPAGAVARFPHPRFDRRRLLARASRVAVAHQVDRFPRMHPRGASRAAGCPAASPVVVGERLVAGVRPHAASPVVGCPAVGARLREVFPAEVCHAASLAAGASAAVAEVVALRSAGARQQSGALRATRESSRTIVSSCTGGSSPSCSSCWVAQPARSQRRLRRRSPT